MPSRRDREFAEFVNTRGPVLWRMASLLELGRRDAERALTEALARTYRRWSSVSREGGVERATRDNLSNSFFVRHTRDGTLDVVESVQGDLSPERSALARLTARQRLTLVLTVFTGASLDEVIELYGVSPHQFAWIRRDAERLFRSGLGAPSNTGLLPLLQSAALADMPQGLTTEAKSARRSGRGRLLAVSGAVIVAIAVAVAVIPWGSDEGATGAEGPVNEWGIPRDLRVPDQVQTLVEAPIERASTAFIANQVAYVADAESGEMRAVFDPQGVPEWLSEAGESIHPIRPLRWSQALLSPNGEWLLLVQVVPDTRGYALSSSRASVGALYLVNVKTGEPTRIRDMQPSPRAIGTAGIAHTRLAWAPDSKGFACACTGRLTVANLGESGTPVGVSPTSVRADSVAWGRSGLAVSDPRDGWTFLNLPLSMDGSFTHAEAFAITNSEPVKYFTVSELTIYALGADTRPDGGQCALWDETFESLTAVAPMSERDGLLCTPVSVQPAGDGVALVMEPERDTETERGTTRARPLEILVVDADGSASVAGEFPAGTTTGSFAAELVG